jgi:hypothetical protein
MKYSEALAELRRRTAPGKPPVLTDADYGAFLASARRPDRYGYLPDGLADWIAGAVYPVGAAVRPSTPNGHFYIVVDNNTDGAVSIEPAPWPLLSGEQVTAPDGYIWQEAGVTSYTPTYDLDQAAADAWEHKAGLAADQYNLSDNGLSLSRSQIMAQCQMQARYWRRKIQDSIPTGYGSNYRIGIYPGAGVVVPLDNGPYLP